MTKGAEKFLRNHRDEFEPVVAPEVREALARDEPLTPEQIRESIERVETKVFTWERPAAQAGAKRVLLEASEPAAYKTVKPLIAYLQNDERCGAITLVTDNTAGVAFAADHIAESFEQVRDPNPNEPVFADIAAEVDSILILGEPKNSADKPLLYGGKKIFGDEHTKLVYLLDGLLGHATRELLSSEAAVALGDVDTFGVGTEFSKELLEAAVPRLRGRVEVVGSVLLESLKQNLAKSGLLEATAAAERRHTLRQQLHIPNDAVTVLYSGFPSGDYAPLGEKTLTQITFEKTLEAVQLAAEANTEKQFALVIRAHPRASESDNDLRVPEQLPPNLHVVWANGPTYSYDEVANAADIVACQSSSTEVLYAPYRGVVAAVSGYVGEGMQEEINENVFGPGLAAFKHSPGVIYVDSVETLARELATFQSRPERRPFPDNPVPRIADLLLTGAGEERATIGST